MNPRRTIQHFDNPPVIETVLGVQFDPSPKIHNALLAIFWDSLGKEWPNVEEVPCLDQQFEQFDDKRAWSTLGQFHVRLSQENSARLRITNPARTRMIQVQNGRFHYNWMKNGQENYPQYDVVRGEFDKEFERFNSFLAERGISSVKINQWEVTYINHITKGPAWDSPSDWPQLFRGFPTMAYDRVVNDTFTLNTTYEIKPQLGRLHANMRHGFIGSPSEKKDVVRIELTARGSANDSSTLDAGLNLGREIVVNAFHSLTSEKCHSIWGHKNEK